MDIADLKEILGILEEQDITEFELEQDGVKLRVCRSTGGRSVITAAPAGISQGVPVGQGTASEVAPGESPVSPPTAQVKAAPAAVGPAGTVVKSPIVGTFYRAPDPNSAPFVEVGDRVKVGQVLCIIEAMKLMNEIEAEVAGEILKVHVENGHAVQYGDALFTVKPA